MDEAEEAAAAVVDEAGEAVSDEVRRERTHLAAADRETAGEYTSCVCVCVPRVVAVN